ncbi:hypothetical protein V8D89_008989 [Ganoderma adspersum]
MDELEAHPGGTNGTQGGGQEQRERDVQFWYEDGTVILVVYDIKFRVYKGVLVQHSLFFCDMFSLPQPQDADTKPCPVACIIPGSPRWPSFNLISACICLGHKYQIKRLLDVSIAYLKGYYTMDLDTWQNHWAYYDEYEQESLSGFIDLHTIDVLNLVCLTGQTLILPTAFFQCHLLEERIINGFNRVDSSHEELQLVDLKCCLKVKEDLTAASLVIYVRMYQASISDRCTTHDACITSFQDTLTLLDRYSDIVTKQDPSQPLLHIHEASKNVMLCTCCTNLAMEQGKEAQEEFWKKLPRIFNIQVDGW